MDLSKGMRISLFFSNLFCLVLAILVLSMSIGLWHEYTGGAISIIVCLLGFFMSCTSNHVALYGFSVLVAIDLLIMLANGIYLAIIKSGYSDFCFDNDGDFNKAPKWGCWDWRNGHYARATGVMVCLFLAVILRALAFASTCLLARQVYDDDYDDGVGESRKTHDLGERGRQY